MSEDIKQQLRDWVVANSKTAASVEDDTPIIEQRVITSMQVMDFILFIERLRDQPIDATKTVIVEQDNDDFLTQHDRCCQL